jgi:hypothetical protein
MIKGNKIIMAANILILLGKIYEITVQNEF